MIDPLSKTPPLSSLPPSLRRALPGLRRKLLAWHAQYGRHDLPWQVSDPYAIWISEVMLQQTQVATALPRFEQWMRRFPTVVALAGTSQEEVLRAWEGLGYYARARNLHAAAQQIVSLHGGQMPPSRPDRLALPGVGPSTASAIGAFAFGAREAICDANVIRVLKRWLSGKEFSGGTPRELWGVAQHLTPTAADQVRAYTQAIMDLGATVCTPKAPRCGACPWSQGCGFRAAAGSPDPSVKASSPLTQEDLHLAWDDHSGLALVQAAKGEPWEGLWTLPVLPANAPPAGEPWAQGKAQVGRRRIHWRVWKEAAPPDHPRFSPAQVEQKALPRFLRQWLVGQVGEAS